MSTNFSINYMGLWEKMNNPNFNLTGFRDVKMLSTETGFALSPKQYVLLIRQELPQSRRLVELDKVAITQMRSLLGSKEIKRLK